MSTKTRTDLWVWTDYGVGPEYSFARKQLGITGEQIRLARRGDPLGEPLPKPRLDLLTEGKLTDLLAANVPFVVSDPLLAALQVSGARLQVIPVRVIGVKRKYHLANILEKVPCLDETRSKVTRWKELDNIIRSIRKLVLMPIPADAPPIFHIAEFPLMVLVRDDLRRSIQAACEAPGVFTPSEKATYA
jgi:hypothetical protein